MLPTGTKHVTEAMVYEYSEECDFSHLISKLNSWIDQLIASHEHKKISCSELRDKLRECFPDDFLSSCHYVVVDKLPFPEFEELKKHKKLFAEDKNYYAADAITYKNTYFILNDAADEISTHFHELVHVQQWKVLGDINFLARYLSELNSHDTHSDLPLEKMAYELQLKFEYNQKIQNLLDSIRLELLMNT